MRRPLNLKSPLAVVVAACAASALAGAGGAAATGLITGSQVKDSSLTGRDIKNKSLTKSDFRGLARGPEGHIGPIGPVGPPGPTVAAYALVGDPGEAFGETHPTVVVAQTRGFSGPDSITRTSTGIYCLVADGVSARDRVAVASVDISRTNEGIARDATVVVDSNPAATPDGRCPEGGFKVRTYATSQGQRVLSNSVAFTLIVP
jgi:hypothetical protein